MPMWREVPVTAEDSRALEISPHDSDVRSEAAGKAGPLPPSRARMAGVGDALTGSPHGSLILTSLHTPSLAANGSDVSVTPLHVTRGDGRAKGE